MLMGSRFPAGFPTPLVALRVRCHLTRANGPVCSHVPG